MEKIMSKTTHNTEVRGELTPADLDLVVGGRVMCEGDTGAAGRTSSSGGGGSVGWDGESIRAFFSAYCAIL
jgi:hypothetical protein